MSYSKRWQNILLLLLVVFGLVYSLPNLYPEKPAVVIRAPSGQYLAGKETSDLISKTGLKYSKIIYENQDGKKYSKLDPTNQSLKKIILIHSSVDDQVKMKDQITSLLETKHSDYIVAMNLLSDLPKWMKWIHAKPLKRGLDLQGGIHLLLNVDVDSLSNRNQDRLFNEIKESLMQHRVHNNGLTLNEKNEIIFSFRDTVDLENAFQFLTKTFGQLRLEKNDLSIIATTPHQNDDAQINIAVNQTKNIIERRVNELGVSEAVVQREGKNQISVDLPGIQDIAKAKDLIGKGATVKFFLVDPNLTNPNESHPNRTLVYDQNGERPLWIKNDVILSGDQITHASASVNEKMEHIIQVTPTGDTHKFRTATRDNIHQRLAIVYYENKSTYDPSTGKIIKDTKRKPYYLSAPVIQQQLIGAFSITGMQTAEQAQDLALLIRSGSMPTPIAFAEELMIGPSMGAQNIKMGLNSLLLGLGLVVVFMASYYRLFGLIANIGLIFNVLLTLASLSLIGATLTLPGIAGIVLGVGMAVDANVLINERIREELRLGVSPKAAIQIGYEKAFATIVDANVTTLIVALVLFGLGSGVVKGFAITLSIGLLASMITAVTFTRVIVNRIYRNHSKPQISIGI